MRLDEGGTDGEFQNNNRLVYFRIIDYLRFVRTTSPEVLYKQD
jgi:hypothetical protein